MPESDFFDDRNYRLNDQTRYEAQIRARSVQFDWSIRTSKLKSAREALAQIRSALDSLLSITPQGLYAQFLDADYWTKMARLAEAEGKAADFAEYQGLRRTRRTLRRAWQACPSRRESRESSCHH